MIIQCYFCGTYNSIDGNLSEETLRKIFDGWVKFVQDWPGGKLQPDLPDKLEMPACPQCAVSPERRQSYLRQRGCRPPEIPMVSTVARHPEAGDMEPLSLVYAPYIPEAPNEQQRTSEED